MGSSDLFLEEKEVRKAHGKKEVGLEKRAHVTLHNSSARREKDA